MRNDNYTLVFGITQKIKYFCTFLEEVIKTVAQDIVSDDSERNEGTKSIIHFSKKNRAIKSSIRGQCR